MKAQGLLDGRSHTGLHRHPALTAALALASLMALDPVPAGATPGDVKARVKLPGPCVTGLAWDGRYLWAADHKTDSFYQMDSRTGTVVRRIPSPGHRPAGLAWSGKHLWSLDVADKRLYKVDPRTRTVVHTVESPVAAPKALAWDGKWLWLSDRKSKTLRRIDPDDGTTVSSIPAPSRSVDGLAWDGRYLWATDRLADKIYMLDPKRGEVIFALKAPGPHATGIAYDGKELLVADYQTDVVYRVVRRDRYRYRRSLRRVQEVEFTYEVRNYGPDPLTRVQIFLGMPRPGPSQSLLRPVQYLKPGGKILADWFPQKVMAYTLGPVQAGKSVKVGFTAAAQLFDVRYFVFPHAVKPLYAIPPGIRLSYLKDGRKYKIGSPIIRKAVRKAVGNERNPYWRARKIYAYIHKKMHYELAGGWNVAPRVLTRGSGSCSEYSFLFIAMCRAAGIPARYVGSVVVRRDAASYDDVFHRWVEIYLPGFGWLPVDPSRGDKRTQAKRGDAFHHLTADFLVTTRSAGPSRFLGWTYNGKARWHCQGRCKVATESIAEWKPIGKQPHAAK